MKITGTRVYMTPTVAFVEVTANQNLPANTRPAFRFNQSNGDAPVTGTASDDVTSGHVAKYSVPLSGTFSVADGLSSLEMTSLGGLPGIDIVEAAVAQSPDLEF